jgi:hypothetical protein
MNFRIFFHIIFQSIFYFPFFSCGEIKKNIKYFVTIELICTFAAQNYAQKVHVSSQEVRKK